MSEVLEYYEQYLVDPNIYKLIGIAVLKKSQVSLSVVNT